MQSLKWPNRITIVRHGESEQNVALDLLQKDIDQALASRKKTRDADIKLTSVGEWQASETGKHLAKQEPYDVCFVSPYLRTQRTCERIVEQLTYDLTVYSDFRIREKEFGLLHGFTTEEIKSKYPEEYEHRERDGKFYYRLPRGENYLDVTDRLYSFLSKLSRDYAGQNVLIISHHVPFIMFRGIIEHLDEDQILQLDNPHNCAIEQFDLDTSEYSDGRLKLTLFNKVVWKLSKERERLLRLPVEAQARLNLGRKKLKGE